MPGATAKILLWTYFKNCVFLCVFIPHLYFSTEGHLHLGCLKNKCERLHPSCLVLAWFLSGAETKLGDNHTRVYSGNTCERKRAGSWRRLGEPSRCSQCRHDLEWKRGEGRLGGGVPGCPGKVCYSLWGVALHRSLMSPRNQPAMLSWRLGAWPWAQFFLFLKHLKKKKLKKILAAPPSMWDLSSLTRDWTRTPCSGVPTTGLPGTSPQFFLELISFP